MADITDKTKYFEYVDKIIGLLKDDKFYSDYKARVLEGRNTYETFKKVHKKVLDMTWVKAIEDSINDLDAIVRNPRKFIAQEEDIVDISLARSISTESVKHLAQHTNMIAKVDKFNNVTPNKILNISKEESFEIYENRFIYTLLRNLKHFVSQRFDKIKAACAVKDVFQMTVDSDFKANNKKLSVKLDCMAQMSFDDVVKTDNAELSDIERVAKIDRIISDFLASSFAKQMISSSPVRPPIQRTNVILKNPNFKKALILWQFIENYREEGFKLIDEVEANPIVNDPTIAALTDLVTLNSFVFETITEQQSAEATADFTDWDQLPQIEQPEILPPEEEVPEEPEQEPIQEEKPEEPELPPEEEKKEEEQKPEEPEEEKEQDFQADDNLYPFEVKKLYKRPEDDRISPEEIRTINMAIDRVLANYYSKRTAEQIELEKYDRIRRKQLEKEAEAELERARQQEEARLKALDELQRLKEIAEEIDLKQKELDALEAEAAEARAAEVAEAEREAKEKHQQELDALIAAKAEELVALKAEEARLKGDAEALPETEVDEGELTVLPIDEAAAIERVFDRAIGAVNEHFIDEPTPEVDVHDALAENSVENEELYDPDEYNEDKYLVARRMIKSRYSFNKEHNVRGNDANKTLENIYRAFSAMRKKDDVRF